MSNPFYVQPGNQFAPAMAGLQNTIRSVNEKRDTQRAEKEAKEKYERIKMEAKLAYDSGDPDLIADFMINNPEYSKAVNIDSMLRHKNKRTLDNALSAGYEFTRNPTRENLAELLEDRKSVLESEGVDPSSRFETDSILDQFDEDPDAVVSGIHNWLAERDTDRYIKHKEAMMEEEPPAEGDYPGWASTAEDRFVVDAKRAWEEDPKNAGKKIPASVLTEARLQHKRAQYEEVRANEMAKNMTKAEWAERIAYNSKVGQRLGEIETEAKLREAKGEITPEQKKNNAKQRMTIGLVQIARKYNRLKELGAIVSTENEPLSNIFAKARSSAAGQAFAGTFGLEEQSVRAEINNMVPLILQDVRQATEMGARGLDSEKELEFYKQAASDPKRDFESNIAAIVALDRAYGTGEIAEQLSGLTTEDLVSELSEKGRVLAKRAPVAAEDYLKANPNFKDQFKEKYGYLPEGF